MNKRPLSVTILSWFFILFGVVAVAAAIIAARKNAADSSGNFAAQNLLQYVLVPILINSLALASGIFTSRGHNWARYFLVAWLGFHVILSVFHSYFQVAAHSIFLAAAAFILFRPPASQFFRGPTGPSQPLKSLHFTPRSMRRFGLSLLFLGFLWIAWNAAFGFVETQYTLWLAHSQQLPPGDTIARKDATTAMRQLSLALKESHRIIVLPALMMLAGGLLASFSPSKRPPPSG